MRELFLSLALASLVAGCGEPPTITPDGGPRPDAGRDAGANPDAGACPGSDGCPACNNGLDDDDDGLIDYPLDPGCARRTDDDEGEPPPAGPCANGVDDDHDGLIDYPEDPGCADEEDTDETDPPPPACDDGADDDDDGKNDYPEDPGCASARDDDETDTCPGTGCPACANGADDDGDDATDYPSDAECRSASDDDERCIVIGNFDDDWPGDWVDLGGGPASFSASRRGAAAHDGPLGLENPTFPIRNTSVTVGAAGESVSVWVRTLGDSNTVHAIEFAMTDAGSYECLLSIAGQLSMYESPSGGAGTSLESAEVSVELLTWYRLELAFLDAGAVECRVYAADGTTLLSSVSHTFATSLEGQIGLRGAPLAAFDTVEVCR